MSQDTLNAEVANLVESVVLRPVGHDELLLESGLVDSLRATEIVLGVEMQFGVRMPPTEITEHLASVSTLGSYIASQRKG